MPAPLRMGPVEWTLLVLLSLVWGASFLFGRVIVAEVPPLTATWLRVALAASALWIALPFFVRVSGPLPWRRFAVMGLLNNAIPFTLILYGQTAIGAGLAAIVNAMTPIWTVLLAGTVTDDERLSSAKLAGVALGFAGVAVLIGAAALEGLEASVWAQVAVLGATVSYACAGLYGRRFRDVAPALTARGQLTMAALIMLPLALLDRPWTLLWPSAEVVWSMALLATMSTALAYILFFTILARAGATNVLLVTFLVPLSAIALGALFLDEVLAPRHLVGLVLIVGGLALIDGRLVRPIRQP